MEIKKILKSKLNFIFLALVLGLLIRLTFVNFPNFTSQESLYGARGYFLAKYGKDELGRNYPLIFNSAQDYELPLTSYFTSFGISFFGKNDFGVRIPFVILGTICIWLIYLISRKFDTKIANFALLLTALSPTLIFLSVTSNTLIISLFLNLIFLYYLIQKKLSYLLISIIILLAFFTSKNFWLILPSFVLFVLLYIRPKLLTNPQRQIVKKDAALILGFSIFMVSAISIWFFLNHAAFRSFSENNFSIFQSTELQNEINLLRGYGLQAGWPELILKLLFNKLMFVYVGVINWTSYFSPLTYFGQFDPKGIFGFISFGALPRVAIIPFVIGTYHLILGKHNLRLLLPLLPIITFPGIFIYPENSYELIIYVLPIFILITAYGFSQLKKYLAAFLICLIFLELLINFLIFNNSFFDFEKKSTQDSRPTWISQVMNDAKEQKFDRTIYLSENLSADFINFALFGLQDFPADFHEIKDPYKFNMYKYNDLNIITTEKNIIECKIGEKTLAILGPNDLSKIAHVLESQSSKQYKDLNGDVRATLVLDRVCLD